MQEGLSYRKRLMPFRLNSINWTQRSVEWKINLLLKVNFLFLFIISILMLFYATDNVNRHHDIKMVSAFLMHITCFIVKNK